MATRQRIIPGDCIAGLRTLPDASVHCCVTSPPYWGLRDYGHDGQIGLESTPEAYVARMVEVFREVRRVLRDDGTLWLNLGDTYSGSGGYAPNAPSNRRRAEGQSWGKMHAFGRDRGECRTKANPGFVPDGLKAKDLVGIPWRVAFALQADGWWLRQDIIWHKPNPMPESVRDRCTKAHEYVFLMTKSERYYYDADALREPYSPMTTDTPQRRRMIASQKFSGEHDFRYRRAGEPCACCDGSGVAFDPPDQTGAACKGCNGTGKTVNATGERMLRINELGRNRRSVWTIKTKPYKGAHFAVMPPDLAEPCIKAGCPEGGTVLDPFGGSGTTLAVAAEMGRNAIGCELNPDYIELAERRILEARQSVALFEANA